MQLVGPLTGSETVPGVPSLDLVLYSCTLVFSGGLYSSGRLGAFLQ